MSDPIDRSGLAPRFWETKALKDLSEREWEALCDGCGKCCLNKLEDEESGEVALTDVACRSDHNYLHVWSPMISSYFAGYRLGQLFIRQAEPAVPRLARIARLKSSSRRRARSCQ